MREDYVTALGRPRTCMEGRDTRRSRVSELRQLSDLPGDPHFRTALSLVPVEKQLPDLPMEINAPQVCDPLHRVSVEY
jgi:hypothetical protein